MMLALAVLLVMLGTALIAFWMWYSEVGREDMINFNANVRPNLIVVPQAQLDAV